MKLLKRSSEGNSASLKSDRKYLEALIEKRVRGLKNIVGFILYLHRSKCQHYCKQRRPHTFSFVILKKDRKIKYART